ncbi:hypothetical protein [Actinomadura madurae]|uniref:hypothetical protein n=1 Tax=Actinomadura madurae TaxID=1993 RepID=UPI00399BA66C
MDGATWARRFWHITVPQIRPEIFVVLLWTTIAALKAFPQIFVLTKGGPGGGDERAVLLLLGQLLREVRRRLRLGDRDRADARDRRADHRLPAHAGT